MKSNEFPLPGYMSGALSLTREFLHYTLEWSSDELIENDIMGRDDKITKTVYTVGSVRRSTLETIFIESETYSASDGAQLPVELQGVKPHFSLCVMGSGGKFVITYLHDEEVRAFQALDMLLEWWGTVPRDQWDIKLQCGGAEIGG